MRLAVAVGVVVLLPAVGYLARQVIFVGNGYVAKTVCSAAFISGRRTQAVRSAEIQSNDPGMLRLVSVEVDRPGLAVRSHFLGLAEREVVFREGLGCTLATGVTPRDLSSRGLPPSAGVSSAGTSAWRSRPATGPAASPGLDPSALAAALEEAFAEPGAAPSRRTRAIVVVHDGNIVAERYAPGYGPDSPLPGWSMTKSVVNALVGVLVREGTLALDAPPPVPEWSAHDDPRRAITLRHLLHMTSGLYAPSGDEDLPRDAYHAVGHEGQLLTIIPSRRLVAVRLGLSVGHGVWDHAAFLRRLLSLSPPGEPLSPRGRG
jgi:hypothetical protein